MRSTLVAGLLAAAISLAAPGAAETAGDAIRRVISDQITAFRADDVEAAFAFASPAIKRLFQSPDRFGAMVRDGYPMVWRPADVRFATLDERDGWAVQSVVVTDEHGAPHVVEYEMIETERGWEINGVRVRRPNDAGA